MELNKKEMSPGSTTMKLATALSERADLQKRIADLGNRLKGNINSMVKIIIIAILIYLLLGVVFTALVTDGSRFFVLHYTLIWPFHLFLLVVIFEFCRRWSKNNPNGI